ncbi:MAG: hypothetical protein KDC98_25970 [Planctomycetes bacterium]|nr:hypothetical protein [Planctomycetota bacterium]
MSILLFGACAAPRAVESHTVTSGVGMLRANLGTGDEGQFAAIASAFAASNPGHDLEWWGRISAVRAAERPRVLLVQAGGSRAWVVRAAGRDAAATAASEVAVGDVIVLAPGESVRFDAELALLAFTLPETPAAAVPRVIRPDYDSRITDTPGGCATDIGAYRRVLLTWLGKAGPYTFHGLNVHRVRIDDSFTHYHPKEGGFDEFYLVQAVRPGARIVTSEAVARIVHPESITRDEVPGLLRSTDLAVGDLVYLPRGTAHRGLGGVLAQVISVPGFVPGSEIGIDHHLRAINERLGLSGDEALPLHAAGAERPIVR